MRVRMVNSVDEYAAGQLVILEPETADRFIILGYAKGELSREYSDDEIADAYANVQEVSLGG